MGFSVQILVLIFFYFTRFVETRRAPLNDILEVITKIVRIENSVVNQSYS